MAAIVIDLVEWRKKHNRPVYPDYIVRIADAIEAEVTYPNLIESLDAVIDAFNYPE